MDDVRLKKFTNNYLSDLLPQMEPNGILDKDVSF
jgi:hypothetical protein